MFSYKHSTCGFSEHNVQNYEGKTQHILVEYLRGLSWIQGEDTHNSNTTGLVKKGQPKSDMR